LRQAGQWSRLRVPESFDIQPGGGKPDRIFEPLLESERVARTVTPRDIEAAGGMTAVEVVELVGAFGLTAPAPDDPWFTPAEADVVIALSQLREVWPRDVYLQAARVYGHALSEIAENEVHLFRYDVEQRLRADSSDPAEAIPRVRAAFERLLPLADPMIVAVHRRWIEHELAQAAVREAELRSPGSLLPGAQQVSFLFCDLKDFTAYADTNGDAAAIEAIGEFSGIVHEEQGGGRVVKGIGDAYMLVYARPEPAVVAGARIVRRMHAVGPPFVHASVHHGVAVYREGDYFGRAVNLAARLLGLSGDDELVVTSPVVEACGDRQRWRPRGAIDVRGMSAPVDVYTLIDTGRGFG
jgi:adenylate cyclase